MRVVFGLVLIIGLGLAGFAVYMARDFIGTQQEQLAAERAARANIVKTVDVLVVKDSVRYGDVITADSVRTVRWPEDAMPEGAFKSLAELFPEGGDDWRTVLRTMEKDEAVLAVKVTEPGADAGVSSRLTRGMRAFAIKVDVASGVSGFLRPGDQVDVYWTGQATLGADERSQGVTRLIESSVQVIAIDQTADTDRNNAPTIARTITVEATPQQVAALAQAQSTGKLSLSLVGAGDDTRTGAVEIDQNSLLGIQVRAPDVIQADKVCTIKTRRGSDIIETEIACPDS